MGFVYKDIGYLWYIVRRWEDIGVRDSSQMIGSFSWLFLSNRIDAWKGDIYTSKSEGKGEEMGVSGGGGMWGKKFVFQGRGGSHATKKGKDCCTLILDIIHLRVKSFEV
ncbi:hypothetical protein HYU14_00550 [Candidatus Woesearchaeota archaeon]|nr:hypothetical protein [Candidatus Woesearchaeota archaeon]